MQIQGYMERVNRHGIGSLSSPNITNYIELYHIIINPISNSSNPIKT